METLAAEDGWPKKVFGCATKDIESVVKTMDMESSRPLSKNVRQFRAMDSRNELSKRRLPSGDTNSSLYSVG